MKRSFDSLVNYIREQYGKGKKIICPYNRYNDYKIDVANSNCKFLYIDYFYNLLFPTYSVYGEYEFIKHLRAVMKSVNKELVAFNITERDYKTIIKLLENNFNIYDILEIPIGYGGKNQYHIFIINPYGRQFYIKRMKLKMKNPYKEHEFEKLNIYKCIDAKNTSLLKKDELYDGKIEGKNIKILTNKGKKLYKLTRFKFVE